MAIDFPNSPTVGQNYTVGNRTWQWDGTSWNLQTTFLDPIPKTVVDAKGDLVIGTASDTVGRLGAASNGQLLVTDSATSQGVKWSQAWQDSNFVMTVGVFA